MKGTAYQKRNSLCRALEAREKPRGLMWLGGAMCGLGVSQLTARGKRRPSPEAWASVAVAMGRGEWLQEGVKSSRMSESISETETQ